TDVLHHFGGAHQIAVGDRHRVDELAPGGDRDDRLADRAGTHQEDAHAKADQAASASARGASGRPRASATAAFVMLPPTVFTPSASSVSAATAWATPIVASASAYGSVALVSA